MLENGIIAIISFIVLFFILFLWNSHKLKMIKKDKRKKGKPYDIIELRYLSVNSGLNAKKLQKKKFIVLISLINALIITLVFFVIVLLPWKLVWQLLLGFVLLMGLIYGVYGIMGAILKKKGYDK